MCLCEMLKERLKMADALTWEILAKALERRSVGENKLAGELRSKFVPSTFEGTLYDAIVYCVHWCIYILHTHSCDNLWYDHMIT